MTTPNTETTEAGAGTPDARAEITKSLDGIRAEVTKLAESGTATKGDLTALLTRFTDIESRISQVEIKGNRPAGAGGDLSSQLKSIGRSVIESDLFKDATAGKTINLRGGGITLDIEGGLQQRLQQKDLALSDTSVLVPYYEDPDIANIARFRMPTLRMLYSTVPVTSDSVTVIRKTKFYHLYLKLDGAVAATDTTITCLRSIEGVKVNSTLTLSPGLAAEETAVVASLVKSTRVITLTAAVANNHLDEAEVTSDEYIFTAATELKPNSHVTYAAESYTVEVMATIVKIPKQSLDDAARLEAELNEDLPPALARQTEKETLYGSGATNRFTGILVDTDVPSYLWSSGEVGDTIVDACRRALKQLRLNEAGDDPNAVYFLLHPTEVEGMELAKGDDGHYLKVFIIEAGQVWIWRVPVLESSVINAGTGLVGNFRRGARIYDRQVATVQLFEQDEDNVQRNLVTVRAEERLAFAVKEPEAFVKITFDNAPV